MELVYFHKATNRSSSAARNCFNCHLCDAKHTNLSDSQTHYLKCHSNVIIVVKGNIWYA